MKASIHLNLLLLSVAFGLVLSQGSFRRDQVVRRRPVKAKEPTTTTTERPRISENDDEESDQCPEPNGYFADAEQCDKYYECSSGKITEKLCPDGMVFNDYSPDQEKCDLPFNIDCSSRPKLQEPKPTMNCPRLHGYFGHPQKGICDKFYYCVDGQFNMITCPAGLVFNPKTGICTWPDEAQKMGCSSDDVFNFSCPKVDEATAGTHPRFSDPDDCQFFYVCINGEIPRRNGCKLGQVFDDSTKTCNWARKVPECADWYKDRLTDAQLDELENPPTQPPPVIDQQKPSSRRRPSKKSKPRQKSEDEE